MWLLFFSLRGILPSPWLRNSRVSAKKKEFNLVFLLTSFPFPHSQPLTTPGEGGKYWRPGNTHHPLTWTPQFSLSPVGTTEDVFKFCFTSSLSPPSQFSSPPLFTQGPGNEGKRWGKRGWGECAIPIPTISPPIHLPLTTCAAIKGKLPTGRRFSPVLSPVH